MKAILIKIFVSIGRFLLERRNRLALYLLVISIMAFWDYRQIDYSRRTYTFFSTLEDNLFIEERMLPNTEDRETEIRWYIEEALYGPATHGLEPLFPRETRLNSYMLRDAVVYADFTESALLPIPGNGDVYRSFLSLNEGIRRNFPYIEDVKLFIGGNEVFFELFSGFFTNSADN